MHPMPTRSQLVVFIVCIRRDIDENPYLIRIPKTTTTTKTHDIWENGKSTEHNDVTLTILKNLMKIRRVHENELRRPNAEISTYKKSDQQSKYICLVFLSFL